MPVASTVVAPGTCIDPAAKIGGRRYYPTEIERKTPQCKVDEDLKILEDPRYSKKDLSITEYQMMKESDALNVLLGMRLANMYINPSDLQSQQFNLYSRPTIAFKLECE